MIKYKYLLANCRLVSWNCRDGSIWTDEDIRRAMFIGTDIDAIIKATLFEGEAHCFPLNSKSSPAIFTPLEELPASVAELFGYDPETAKQMIIDAGYPDGFSIELVTRSDPDFQDIAALLASQWDKIGVETNIITLTVTLHDQVRGTHDFKDGYLWETGTSIVPAHLHIGQYWVSAEKEVLDDYNMAGWYSPDYDEMYWEIVQEMDPAKMSPTAKQMCIDILDAAPNIPLGNPVQISYTWPWVKNYYGEIEGAFINYQPMINRIWIDQDLKAEMGY